MLNVDGTALHPTKAGEPFPKFRKLAIPILVVFGGFLQDADPPYAVAKLLRARRERPGCHRAAEQRDEPASPYVEHGLPSRKPALSAYSRLRMPRKHPQVLGVDLNCSESRRPLKCGAGTRFYVFMSGQHGAF